MTGIIITIFIIVSKALSKHKLVQPMQKKKLSKTALIIIYPKGRKFIKTGSKTWPNLFLKVVYEKQFTMYRRSASVEGGLSTWSLRKGRPWSMNYPQLHPGRARPGQIGWVSIFWTQAFGSWNKKHQTPKHDTLLGCLCSNSMVKRPFNKTLQYR